jgi:hypothetical protein
VPALAREYVSPPLLARGSWLSLFGGRHRVELSADAIEPVAL